eukprot:3264479-Heterocapsa_arctica.AAC.1
MAQPHSPCGIREQQDLARRAATILLTAASAHLAGFTCEELLAEHPDVLNQFIRGKHVEGSDKAVAF